MKRTSRSFSSRLSTYFILLTSILFLSALFTAAIASHRLIADEATKYARSRLDAAIKEIEIETQKVEDAVDGIAWLVEEHLDDPEYMYHITSKLVRESGTVFGSAVAFVPDAFEGMHYFAPYTFEDQSDGGAIKSMQLGNDKYDYFSMEWYVRPVETGRPCWSEPYIDIGGGEMEMSTYSRPVFGSDGRIRAVITADFYLGIASAILDKVHPYHHSRTVLASKTGKYIVDVKSGFFGQDILSSCGALKDPRAIEAAEDMLNGGTGVARYKTEGRQSLVAYGQLHNGWSAALICDYRDVLRNSSKMHFQLLIVGILGLALLFWLCYVITSKLTKPLADFDRSARSIAEGRFDTSLPEIESEDEIRHLRDSFEYMQNSLHEHITELKETTAAKQRIESELNIASRIQMGIVPHKFPECDGVDVNAVLRPAREVGGDFYDFALRDGRNLYFIIGDVSGKGVPAALVMAITLYSFKFVSGSDLTLDKVVSRINDVLCEGNEENMFVTLFAGRLDMETGELTYCNAGHNPLVLVGPEGEAHFLQSRPNIAVGVFAGFPYVQEHIHLDKGTALLLYTDGVTEAECDDRLQYGEERLLAWAGHSLARLSAAEVCEGLYEDVRDFAANAPQNDDITILTIKYMGYDAVSADGAA